LSDTTSAPRRIWLCADDYGLSHGVNEAIRDLMARGRINATSVMTVTPAFNEAEARALAALKPGAPRMAIGLHFTLTAPFSPLDHGYAKQGPLQDGAFLPLGKTLAYAMLGKLHPSAIEAEVRAQIRRFTDVFGAPPDFVDGHQHVQVFPQVRDAFLRAVSDTLDGAWVRQCGRQWPLLSRLSDAKGLLLDLLSAGFRARARKLGVRFNPAFAGSYNFNANPDFAALFPGFLQALPDDGLVMCHPGFVDDDLRRLDPLTDLREREHAYFAGDAFPAVLAAHRVTLS
jgi:predicted glycoside hydrolase/deacetylase ChbG (UPF0249 family)